MDEAKTALGLLGAFIGLVALFGLGLLAGQHEFVPVLCLAVALMVTPPLAVVGAWAARGIEYLARVRTARSRRLTARRAVSR
jgi:hypothetical protein